MKKTFFVFKILGRVEESIVRGQRLHLDASAQRPEKEADRRPVLGSFLVRGYPSMTSQISHVKTNKFNC